MRIVEFNADPVSNYRLWYNYEILKRNAQLINTFVSHGITRIAPEVFKETVWPTFMEICRVFITRVTEMYELASGEKVHIGESVAFDIDYHNDVYKLSKESTPLDIKRFAYGTIATEIIVDQIKECLEGVENA